MENLGLSGEEGHQGGDENVDDAECSRTEGVGGCIFSEVNVVNCLEDISKIDFKQLREEDVMRYHFIDLEVAFTFYNWYMQVIMVLPEGKVKLCGTKNVKLLNKHLCATDKGLQS
jgi:hypothetical protein